MIKQRIISEQPNANEYDDWIVRAAHNSSERISKAKQCDCLRSLFNTVYIMAKRQTLNIAKENNKKHVTHSFFCSIRQITSNEFDRRKDSRDSSWLDLLATR